MTIMVDDVLLVRKEQVTSIEVGGMYESFIFLVAFMHFVYWRYVGLRFSDE